MLYIFHTIRRVVTSEINFLGESKMIRKNYQQRKTTLKWKKNGELSEIDMLRIIEKLSEFDLQYCELMCDL